MERHKRAITAAGLILLIFIFLSLPLSISSAIKTRLANVFMPVTKTVSAVGRKFGQIWDAAVHSDSMVADNAHLKEEIDTIKAEKAILEEQLKGLKATSEQLQALEGSGFEILSANIVGWEPDIWHNTVIINRGAKDGITKGALAADGDKLAGRIIEVGSGWSRVRLLTDPESVVPALVQKKGIRGIVVTTARSQLRMEYIDNTEGIGEGDVIITSEANYRYEEEKIVFPQGLMIGTISSIEPKQQGLYSVVIKPATDFKKLEKLIVILVK